MTWNLPSWSGDLNLEEIQCLRDCWDSFCNLWYRRLYYLLSCYSKSVWANSISITWKLLSTEDSDLSPALGLEHSVRNPTSLVSCSRVAPSSQAILATNSTVSLFQALWINPCSCPFLAWSCWFCEFLIFFQYFFFFFSLR